MKKIAFFVEGQTERIFINKLLEEIAGQKNITINLIQLRGGTSIQRQEIPITKNYTSPINARYEALIYDCGNDEKVKSDILEYMSKLATMGYAEIIGIRDLFPLPIIDLARLERGLQFVPLNRQPLALPFQIIVAVHEVEAWFLAEYSHFERIDAQLTPSFIVNNMGFTPVSDDMSLRTNPAADLHNIYHLVGKAYTKKKNQVERTVNCLDYANLYMNIKNNILKLHDLITKIDNFLT